jgi:pimeloyl-ACP methyl ester carboxylesterase
MFPLVRGHLVVVDKKSELKWSPDEFDTYAVTYEYEVLGLKNHYQSYGLGVPVILVRTPASEAAEDAMEKFMPQLKQTYAASAFMKIEPFLSQASQGRNKFEAQLQIFDPINSARFAVGKRSFEIETDFTTPLAFLTSQSPGIKGITGLLDAASWREIQGLHMLQTYQKDKIPVVFVHGLMSSPMTWLPMFNELLGNPILRRNYQFLFFMYPTGNPILYSASILRASLLAVRSHFDPDMSDANFNQMVLVGHSMGGVISRQMIIDSKNHVWALVSDQPFEEVALEPRDREILQQVFFFEALPFVSRVVYIAAPHRGSEWADYRIGRLGSSLVKLPGEILNTATGFIKKTVTAPQNLARKEKASFDLSRIPTGVDGLSPSNPVFGAVDAIPVRPDLPYHSIMGNTEAADTPGGSDGIVRYDSAHLEGAFSEKIVHSDHSTHKHPLAILEVQRILLQHLRELGRI